ncbi:MAG: DUF3300 domain-containing protein [Stellaceae bacterium]
MPSRMIIRVLAGIVGIIACVSLHTLTAAQPAPSVPPLAAEQLDRLVAPIALYPDPLLVQILMAATYPLEVVEADRWLQIPANAALAGDELAAALQQQQWDPSVKSLIAFPRVLRMMDDNLSWIEQLGDAFLAQQAGVMDAVQRLRRLADAAGSLAAGAHQTVSAAGPEITIEPANPEIVYVPAYNPACVYGTWPAPAYPPVSIGSWPADCAPVLEFHDGVYPAFGFWAWGSFRWHRHDIRIDHARFAHFHRSDESPGKVWYHDPTHRRGVPYPNPSTAARFLGASAAARREFRGFDTTSVAELPAGSAAPTGRRANPPNVIRGGAARAPVIAAPPIFQSFGRGAQVRSEAVRGTSSRMSPPPEFRAAPAPSFHAAPAPSVHAAPAVGFGRGVHR